MPIAIPAPLNSNAREPLEVSWTPRGRLRVRDLSDGDQTYALMMHLAPLISGLLLQPGLFVGLIATLVMWMVRRGDSIYIEDHGRELVNFGLSFYLITIVLSITIVGIPVAVLYWIISMVALIRGALAASRGEFFRYPMTIRFLR